MIVFCTCRFDYVIFLAFLYYHSILFSVRKCSLSMKISELQALTQKLIHSYDTQSTLPDQGKPLPSLEAIIAVMEDVKCLLFPGFYAEKDSWSTAREYQVGHWLATLHGKLTRLLRLALDRSIITSISDYDSDLHNKTEKLSKQILQNLPHMREMLYLDAQAALEGDPAAVNLEEVILTYPGFEAILIHRFAHQLYLAKIPYLPRALSEYAHTRTGIDLHPGAQIGRSFFIDHGTGVVIGESTHIGNHVKIYQGVTLGALSVKREFCGKKRHPTIEDHVIIYAGATVLGGCTIIGQGSVIGGNVWITESIPAKSRVIGTPASFEMK
jgi:serine O-acetyltransferase